MKCLKNVSVEEIVSEQNSVCGHSILNLNCFVPILDGAIVQNNLTVLANTKIMYGFNTNEGFLKLMQFLTREFPTEKLYSEGFSREMFLKMLSRLLPEADKKVKDCPLFKSAYKNIS